MSITITKFADQARDYHDSGRIKERKSISHESPVKGISNLFYWATIWSEEGGVLEDRAYKGFEIISYITSGKLEHKPSDSEADEWDSVEAGGVQVIRSGNGVSHTERFTPNTRLFQIWLDPDFRRSLQRPGAFADYEPADFETEDFNSLTRLDLCGDESPMWISTDAQIDRYEFTGKDDTHQLEIPANHVFSLVVISGSIQVGEEKIEAGDLVQVNGEKSFEFKDVEAGSIFTVIHPLEVGYKTYTEQLQMSS